jgi:chemotaxis protein CheC
VIKLTDKQHDALIEICNIGVSRAARQLSVLTKEDISITIPEMVVSDVSEVIEIFKLSLDEIYSSISLSMQGSMQGVTVLLFKSQDSKKLAAMLTESLTQEEKAKQNPEDILTEVGNIIISSSLGAMGNMLGDKVELQVPKYTECDVKTALQLPGENDIKLYAVLAISTALHVNGENITSNLLLVFEMVEVPKLLERLDRL